MYGLLIPSNGQMAIISPVTSKVGANGDRWGEGGGGGRDFSNISQINIHCHKKVLAQIQYWIYLFLQIKKKEMKSKFHYENIVLFIAKEN